MELDESDQLHDVCLLLETADSSVADRSLHKLIKSATGSLSASLYKLDLSSGLYRRMIGDSEPLTSDIPAYGTTLEQGFDTHDMLSIAARTRSRQVWSRGSSVPPSRFHNSSSVERAVYPILRQDTAIGLIDVESDYPMGAPDEPLLRLIVSLFGNVIDRRFSGRLLKEIQRPLDLSGTRLDYFHSLAELVKTATGFEFVAIRRLEDEVLRCVAAAGFPGVELRELDLTEDEIVEPFRESLETQQAVYRPATTSDSALNSLRKKPPLSPVQGFLVSPLYVGTEVTGVLSAATRAYFQPSQSMLLGFRALGNAVALAIENFENFHTTTGEIQALVEAAHTALSTIVMQTTRHSAVGFLNQSQTKLARASVFAADVPKVDKLVLEASKNIERAKDAIGKQRHNSIVNPKTTSPREFRLDEILRTVYDYVDGQLTHANIRWKVNVGSLSVYVIPEVLPIAFLQLVENSIDAFGEKGARSAGEGREISWNAESIDAGRRVRLIYSDNAIGIVPRRLKYPATLSADGDRDWPRLLFEPGVTSKAEGTGWGLHYVRLLVNRASAGQPNGIDLLDWKGGVSFKIELPARV